jgi:succinylglutamate desuccinylase
VFFCGGVHADEVLGVEIIVGFISDIVHKYDLEDPNRD